jgi:hypothetical protein
VENKSLKAEVARLMAEIEKFGGSKVEKDSTNSSVPPTQQSIASQAALRTRSLREPSDRKSGGMPRDRSAASYGGLSVSAI